MFDLRIRALYGQIREKDAVISVLHYQLQQEQENGEEGEGVSLGCPAHSDTSPSYSKSKNVIVKPILLIHHIFLEAFKTKKCFFVLYFAPGKCDTDDLAGNMLSFSHVADAVCKAMVEPRTRTPPVAEQPSISLGQYTFSLITHTHMQT